jgi:hypothetical protein
MSDDAALKKRPKRKAARIALAVALLGGVAVVGLYALRKPIAEHFVDQELTKRGVKGTYQLTQLDAYHQRLEHVVIGDPAHPDLTADWVELSTTLGLSTASVDLVRAGGVRVRGVLDNNDALHFGALDKFRSTELGPFKMPDIGLDLSDAQLAIATPYGFINARLDGKGNLAKNFEGKLGLEAPALAVSGCVLTSAAGQLQLDMRSGQAHIIGPIRGDAGACKGTKLTNPSVNADVTLTPDFKGAQGKVSLTSDKIMSPFLSQATNATGAAKGTPLAPFAVQYSKAVIALGAGMAVDAAFEHDPAQGTVIRRVTAHSTSGAAFALAEGGLLRISPAGKVGFDGQALLKGGGFPETQVALVGSLAAFQGKATIATLTAPNARLVTSPIAFSHDARGTHIETSAAFDGPIAGGVVRGLRLPIAGLIGAAGGFTLSNPCLPIAFDRLLISTLALGKTATTACMMDKGVRVASPHLTGSYGGQAMAVAASSATYNQASGALNLSEISGQIGAIKLNAADGRYSASSGQFVLNHIKAQTGPSKQETTLNADAISGAVRGSTASGHYTNVTGLIGNVPLALSNSSGIWRFTDGALTMNGNLNVADIPPKNADPRDKTAPTKRFNPLISNDVVLRYANEQITAAGTLNEPKTGAFVAKVNISHSLKSSVGDAQIVIKQMPLLNFTNAVQAGAKGLQPEMLTPITNGVVTYVYGSISGEGRIHWSDKGVTSDGAFDTQNMDFFSASLGQVYGLKGKIVFTDLLGLVTAPNQVVTMKSVNPGVVVNDGEVHYRLLADNKAEIEGGTFPLAGGRLIIEPTVLDLSEKAERRITFRVDGIDAGKFLNDYKFEDIAATGIFDGELPLIFDSHGGRIEAGRLAVRDAGGTVSYVGPVSNASLGKYGKLAFDALKSIKYRGLTIDLNGALDGEMISLVKLSGTNQAPLTAQKSYFLKQVTGIPFKFNIRITAPFRSLFNTAKNLQDPSDLVQQTLPKNLKASAPPRPDTIKKPVNPPATSIQN